MPKQCVTLGSPFVGAQLWQKGNRWNWEVYNERERSAQRTGFANTMKAAKSAAEKVLKQRFDMDDVEWDCWSSALVIAERKPRRT